MKKGLFLMLLCCFFIGCNEQKLSLNDHSIRNMSFLHLSQSDEHSSVTLLDSDYSSIVTDINSLDFSIQEKEIVCPREYSLVVTTEDDLYSFYFGCDVVRYEKDKKSYLAKDNSSLLSKLIDLKKEYSNVSFYTVSHSSDYVIQESDFVIKLDNVKDYFIFDFREPIYHFAINELEYKNEELFEVSLLYSKDEIRHNKVVIRKDNLLLPNIKISFENKYNYVVTIIPVFDSSKNEIIFSTTYKQK